MRARDIRGPLNSARPVNWQHALADGLVRWWISAPQLGMGGTVLRDLAQSQHGTLTGMAQPSTSTSGWNRTTRRGGSGHISADGSNDYVAFPAITFSATTSFTIALWMQPITVISSSNNFLSDGQQAIDAIWFNGVGTALQFSLGITTYPIVTLSPGFTDNGGWQHMVVGRDASGGGTVLVYKDGVLVGSQGEQTGGPRAMSLSQWCGDTGGGGQYVSGDFDDFRLYTRLLSATEISSLYQNSRLGCPDLLNRMMMYSFAAPVAAQGQPMIRRMGSIQHGRPVALGAHGVKVH